MPGRTGGYRGDTHPGEGERLIKFFIKIRDLGCLRRLSSLFYTTSSQVEKNVKRVAHSFVWKLCEGF